MRYACNQHLRNALFHWARKSILWDPKSKKTTPIRAPVASPTAAPCAAWPTAGLRSWSPYFAAILFSASYSEPLNAETLRPPDRRSNLYWYCARVIE
jgi:hypothetical protein